MSASIDLLTLKEQQDHPDITIHQFAKRQLTWFRDMEKRGTKIHRIDGQLSMVEKVEK